MVIVIIEEVKCTLRIVVNNCLMFQIPHVDNKVVVVFGGKHLQIKPRCMSNINCYFEIDSNASRLN